MCSTVDVGSGTLDKLAQLDQTNKISRNTIPGEGVVVDDLETLVSRAGAKYLSQIIAESLQESNPDSFLRHSYHNSTGCSTAIEVVDGVARTKYCGNRWCMVCNRIRSAELINKYVPIVNQWDAWFTTVTIPNVKGFNLVSALDDMHSVFTKIKRKMRRTLSMDFVAIRKTECTYNAQRDDYHPHYHIIFADRESAQMFKTLWLKYYPGTSEKGQDVRKADVDGLKELFKYFTKLFAKNADDRWEFNSVKMDVIFRAMYKKRTLQPYGFKLSDYDHLVEGEVESDQDDIQEVTDAVNEETETDAKPVESPSDGLYRWRGDNWYNDATGEALTDFKPTAKMKILSQSIRPSPG